MNLIHESNKAQVIETGTPRSLPVLRNGDNQWWLFCLVVVAIKILLLALDPLPKMFIGDSACYLATALVGWIPDDRSYFYGFVIRWVALSTQSLTPLLLLQSLISAATALLLAHACRTQFGLSARGSYVIGLLCALDPFQLVWERYVMTETISLFFYVAGLYFSFLYLKHRRLRHLAIVQGLWLLLIGFRMSYLPVVQVSTVLLPIMAFYPVLLSRWRNRHSVPGDRFRPMRRAALGHLLASVAIMFILHGTYKQVNGWFCGRPPAYLYATGLHLLAFWAPILVPSDATDERLARIIEQGDEFNIKELTARNDQRFEPGHLVPMWQEVEPEVSRANQIAKETALRALKRDPLGVLQLATRTFAQYWNLKELLHYARIDLGHNDLAEDQVAMLADRFHFATDGRIVDAPPTILQRYFLISWPYCYFLLLSPIVGIAAVYRAREKQFALLLLIHLLIVLTVTVAFAVAPSFRYLQPASLLALFLVALCFRSYGPSEDPEFNLS